MIGLPPAPEEVDAFIVDPAPDAFAKVVDKLLGDPHYGERWGRYWLDVARYGEDNPTSEATNPPYPFAWRYRDCVIKAINDDVPYNQFVMEQIAGDLMPPADGKEVNVEGIIATGFLSIGPRLLAEQDKPKMLNDFID